MKIDFFTRYSYCGASSRLRFMQFIPLLEKSGFEIHCSSFFDDAYLQKLYSGKKRNILSLLKYYRNRKKQMRLSSDGTPAVIEYELLPYLPYCCEAAFLKKHPYILNFDDAVDLHYENLPFLKNKYPHLIANAAGIITANDMLTEKYRRWNSNILKLPTIPPSVITCGDQKPDRLTVIWTGTPVTYKFLAGRSAALQLAAEHIDYELLIVAGKDLPPIPGVKCRMLDWSEQLEAEALASAHFGIMPLPDTPFARGKSAYKLICYLRAGIPGIASPVGENCNVISEGETGFFAVSDEDFLAAFQKLADPQVRAGMQKKLNEAGRLYLPETAAARFAEFMRRCFR